MLQLSAQSFDLYEKYAALRAELKINNGPENEILFAGGMERSNKAMSNKLINSQNVDYTKSYIRSGINSIISSMEGGRLYSTRVEAFRLLHYMEQRKHYGSSGEQAAKQEELADLSTRIMLWGNGDVLPQNSAEAIRMLLRDLKDTMPDRVGPYGNDIMQQLEDTAQFDAWTEDLQVKGFNLTALP